MSDYVSLLFGPSPIPKVAAAKPKRKALVTSDVAKAEQEMSNVKNDKNKELTKVTNEIKSNSMLPCSPVPRIVVHKVEPNQDQTASTNFPKHIGEDGAKVGNSSPTRICNVILDDSKSISNLGSKDDGIFYWDSISSTISSSSQQLLSNISIPSVLTSVLPPQIASSSSDRQMNSTKGSYHVVNIHDDEEDEERGHIRSTTATIDCLEKSSRYHSANLSLASTSQGTANKNSESKITHSLPTEPSVESSATSSATYPMWSASYLWYRWKVCTNTIYMDLCASTSSNPDSVRSNLLVYTIGVVIILVVFVVALSVVINM